MSIVGDVNQQADTMTDDQLARKIREAQHRLERLAGQAAPLSEHQPLLREVLAELSINLEELYVAGEELREKNDALLTAREEAERERRRYQDLFEFAPDGYLVTDTAGIICEGNHAASRLLGLKQAYLPSKLLAMYIHEADRSTFRSLLNLLRQEKGTIHQEFALHPRGAEPLPVLIIAANIRDAKGHITGIRWLLHDIRDRKRREEELREVNTRLQYIIDNSIDIIFQMDLQGNYIFSSRSAEAMTGYALDELLTMNMGQLVAPEYRQELAERLAARAKGESLPQPFYFDIVRTDGRRVPVELMTAPVYRDGQLIAIQGIARDVTERKQAEIALRQAYASLEQRVAERTQELARANAALRESQARLAEAQGLAHLGNYEFGIPTGPVVWSAETFRIVGREPEETAPTIDQYMQIVHPDDRATVLDVVDRAVREKLPFDFTYRILCPDGGIRYVQSVGRPIKDASGTVTGIFGTLLDITERKQAELDLLASEQFAYATIDALSANICVLDETGTLIAVNKAWRDFADANPPLIPDYGLGMNYLEVCDQATGPFSEGAAQFAAGIRAVMAGAQDQFSMEYFCPTPIKGHWFIGRVTHFPGHGANKIVVAHEDVTSLKETQLALERERAFLSTTIEVLPFPVVFITPQLSVAMTNAAAVRLFAGVNVSQLADIRLLTPDTRMVIRWEERPAVRASHGETLTAFETVLVLPDDREMPVLMHTAPIYVGETLVAVVIAFQDITALKAADRAKDEFLAILSHELLTPLTSILGWAQVAEEHPDVGFIRQALSVIVRNAKRQQHLLDDLLDVSRIIHGKVTLTKEPTDLWRLATQAVEGVEQSAKEQQITVVLEPPGTPLPIQADVARMTQVINNLLTNALKFTNAGGTVYVTGCLRDGMAVITVRDTGRGLPPEELPHLFTPFRQYGRGQSSEGLGLGLALVKGFVEMHGGHVYAVSLGLGHGSTFTIELPLAEDH
ncbi:MAG: PAS domain-containing sensor histidine kinase [Armatimonadota bacterium]